MQTDLDQEKRTVVLLANGNGTAFEMVYRSHNAAMVRVCSAIVGNKATAEEVTQDTWVAVLGNVSKFEGRCSLASWMYSILINKAHTRLKRDGRALSFDSSGEDDNLQAAFDGRGRWKDMPELWSDLTPERIVVGRNILDHVNSAIEDLPAAQRAVLLLRGQKDLDAVDVCGILGLSEGNMRVLLHRARLAIRKALDDLAQ